MQYNTYTRLSILKIQYIYACKSNFVIRKNQYHQYQQYFTFIYASRSSTEVKIFQNILFCHIFLQLKVLRIATFLKIWSKVTLASFILTCMKVYLKLETKTAQEHEIGINRILCFASKQNELISTLLHWKDNILFLLENE